VLAVFCGLYAGNAKAGTCDKQINLNQTQIINQLNEVNPFNSRNKQVVCLLQTALWKQKYLSKRDVTGVFTAVSRAATFRALDRADVTINSSCNDQYINGQWLSLMCSLAVGTSIQVQMCQDQQLKTTPVDLGPNSCARGPGKPADKTANINNIITSTGEPQNTPSPVHKKPSGCLDVTRESDPDIRRNMATIKKHFCLTKEKFTEAGRTWVLHIFTNKNHRTGPFWGLPHDNENAAFDAAVHAVKKYGGGFVAVASREKRFFAGQDPNRNFGTTHAEARICRGQGAPAPIFTGKFMAHFKNTNYPVLALHNNANGYSGAGGSGGISAKRQTRILRGMPSRYAKGDFKDDDNLIFIAGRTAYKNNKTAQYMTAKLHKAGMNVIYELVTRSGADCSMSNHVLLKSPTRGYFNIETQHGKSTTQKAMIDRLMRIIGVPAIR